MEPPKPKPEAVKPAPPKPAPVVKPAPRDDEMQKRMRDELAREQASLKIDQERELIKDQLSREQASANQKALSAYADKIKAKIRGNILLPQDIKGNPEAVFDVRAAAHRRSAAAGEAEEIEWTSRLRRGRGARDPEVLAAAQTGQG